MSAVRFDGELAEGEAESRSDAARVELAEFLEDAAERSSA